jgi:cell division protein FtsB
VRLRLTRRLGSRRLGSRLAGRRPPTGRAILLGAVLVFLVVVLASPVHRFVSTRTAVQQAERQLATSQAELGELQKQQRQWSDPTFVQQQARARLQYAMPGDRVYLVVRPGEQPALGGGSTGSKPAPAVPGSTWNTRLWGSVEAADRSP